MSDAMMDDMPDPLSAEELEEIHRGFMERTQLSVYTRDDTGHDLTVSEMLFVRSYMIDRNAVAAMRRLGDTRDAKQLKKDADRYLANPEVQNALDELLKRVAEKLEITAEKVIGRIADAAFFDIRQIMHFDGVNLRVLDSSLWPASAAAAVTGIKISDKGIPEIKIVDSLKAAETLGRQMNLLSDPAEDEKKRIAEVAAERAMSKMVEVFDRVEARKKELAALEAPAEGTSIQ